MSINSLDLSQLSTLILKKTAMLGQAEVLNEGEFRFSYLFTKRVDELAYQYIVAGTEARTICSFDLDSVALDIKDKVLALVCFGDFSLYSNNGYYSCEIWKGEKLIRNSRKYASLVSDKGLRLEVVSRPCLVYATQYAMNEVSAIAGLFVGWFENEVLDTFYPGDEEGALQGVDGTRYERSKRNRDICIRYHGVKCAGCSTTLSVLYGDVAENFIHIHHLTRLSDGGRRIVDPIKDLVPVCPNCHSIIHLRVPPYSLEELKVMLNKNRNS